MDHGLLTRFCLESGTKYEENADMSSHSTMKAGGKCDILIRPEHEDALKSAVNICRGEKIPYFILGNGSNVIFREFKGAVISLKGLADISVRGETITASAGAKLAAVCNAAAENSLSGMENLYGIPASAGGALFMNAGAYGSEMKDVVKSARILAENGEISEIFPDEMKLSYRHSAFQERSCVILSVSFGLKSGEKSEIRAKMDEILRKRQEKQPLEFPSCGSAFRRPKNGFAAQMIDECGLKGFSVGGAQVSEKHAGFVINCGGAKVSDIEKLLEHVKAVVKEKYGTELEREIIIVG